MLHDFINLQKRKDFPFIKRVAFKSRSLYLAYCATATPVEFHQVDNGKLIILGAMEANSLPNGLHLDCTPNNGRVAEVG